MFDIVELDVVELDVVELDVAASLLVPFPPLILGVCVFEQVAFC